MSRDFQLSNTAEGKKLEKQALTFNALTNIWAYIILQNSFFYFFIFLDHFGSFDERSIRCCRPEIGRTSLEDLTTTRDYKIENHWRVLCGK